MGTCTQCGIELSDNAKFCPKCGTQQGDSTGFLETEMFLYLGLLCVSVLPGILESLIILMTKHSMNQMAVLAIELIGMLIGFILLNQYLCTLNGGDKNRERQFIAGGGILWSYVIWTIALRLLNGLDDFAFDNKVQIFWVYYIIYALIIALALTLMSRILSRTVSRLTIGNPGKLMRRLKLFWRTLLLLGAAIFFLPDLITILFSGVLFPMPLSFISTVTEWVAVVCVQAILLKLGLKGLVQGAETNSEKNPEVHKPKVQNRGKSVEEGFKAKLSKLMPVIALGLVVAILVYDLISSLLFSTIDAIESTIQNDMNKGAYFMASGDIEMSMYMYDRAYDNAQAWMAFVGDESQDMSLLRNLQKKHPDNDQMEYLLAMKAYSISELESAILEDKVTPEWYLILLDAYHARENNEENPVPLTEGQEIFRRDILNACIASETLINTTITLKDVEGKEKKIIQAMNPYLEFIDHYGVYKILNEISFSGGINPTIMNKLLTYAEENKENLLAQYMAFEAGSNYLYDGAPHYARTADTAIRFRDLYLDILDKDADVKSLTIAVDMEVSDVLMSLQDYSNAVIYLEEAADLGAQGNIRLLTARCYEAMENYEKALEMAELAVEDDGKDYEALNLAMTSALKVGEVTKSMIYGASLLELLPELEGDDYLLADTDLYIYVQYLTVFDQTQWTPQMKYKVYPDLDEDQLQILEENQLLDHYVKALYYTFGGRDFDQAWLNAEVLLAQMSESAQVQYLAGTIQFNKREFETAADYYRASLEIDDSAPTLWFALANAYDAMEDYETAYDYSLKVSEMLQYNNHAVDLYGVQPHNARLLSSLKSKIGQGGQ